MAKSFREMKRLQARRDAHYLRQMEATSFERQMAALFRNGITTDDVTREKKAAFTEGQHMAEKFTFQVIYAAILITMVEKHEWDSDAVVDLLKEIDHQVVLCVEDVELAREAYEKTGISLNWDDPFERIQEKEE